MSRPRAATSVATKIEDSAVEKRSIVRRRWRWIMVEWRAWTGRLRFCK